MLYFRLTAVLAVILVLTTLPAPGADPRSGDEDPWKGKTRDDVVQKLGEPQKVKRAGRDGETLTYKFFRVNPADVGMSGLRVMPVPGVGLVGVEVPGVGDDTVWNTAPTETDEKGRPSGGGSLSSRTSRTYDPEKGGTSDTVGNTPAGKIKLRFVLDAHGRVKDWSVKGKR